jgi:two-component system, sensor histidine kinase and response regulator
MTAGAQPADRARALASGMDGYVAKPITLASLAAALERIPKGRGAGASGIGRYEAVFDSKGFLARYEGSRELGAEILGLFLAQSRPLFEEAGSALASGDLEGARARIHRLKGSTGAIGGHRAAEAAEAFLDATLAPTPDPVRLASLIESFGRELSELENSVTKVVHDGGLEPT